MVSNRIPRGQESLPLGPSNGDHPTSERQVQKWSTANGGPYDRAVTGPLPDESLDALVHVLDEVRFGRSRSRSELVERTGLGRAIVAPRVGELIERGLVGEGDPGPSTGGRPPRQLTFRADAGHLLVADLGATSIDVALTTLDGRILGHHDEPAAIEAGPEAGLGRVDCFIFKRV